MEVVSKLVMVETVAIRPYHRNPRKNDQTVARLVELIPKVGFNQPLVLDRQNVIVKGHARWKAAVKLGMRAIPCVYTDADPEAIKLDRLADNRVQEFSAWDNGLLGTELAALPEFAVDLAALDFRLAPLPEPAPREDEESAAPGEGGERGSLPGDSMPSLAPPGADAGGDAPGEPPPAAAAGEGETAGLPDLADYVEVVCSQCGHVLFISASGDDNF